MKALTIWQPYASLAVSFDQYGTPFKRVETRSWKTGYRGPLAVHSAKRKPDMFFVGMGERTSDIFAYAGLYGDQALMNLPYGCVVGKAELLDCVPIEQLYGTEYDTAQERAFGDWNNGRYGWILGNPVHYVTPIPAVGKQGLWEWVEPEWNMRI